MKNSAAAFCSGARRDIGSRSLALTLPPTFLAMVFQIWYTVLRSVGSDSPMGLPNRRRLSASSPFASIWLMLNRSASSDTSPRASLPCFA